MTDEPELDLVQPVQPPRYCPICGTELARIKVRATKKMPWTEGFECPADGWFEVDPVPTDEEAPRG